MSNTRKFFHDRFVLFLLTLNGFLVFASVVSVLLRIGGPDDIYTQAVRFKPGLDDFTVGGVSEIMSFPIFAVAIFIAQIVLSLRFYEVRKQIAWVTLVLGSLLLLLCLIVSNALLELR